MTLNKILETAIKAETLKQNKKQKENRNNRNNNRLRT